MGLPHADINDLEVGDLLDWDDYPQRMRRVRVVALRPNERMVKIATVATVKSRAGKQRPEKEEWVSVGSLYQTGVVFGTVAKIPDTQD